MLKFIQRMSKRFVDAATCFLRDPKRGVAAAGMVFGLLFVINSAVLIAIMFIPTTPLAATVAPLLSQLNMAILGLLAVIVLTQLGFDKLSLTLPNGTSLTAEDAREKAVESLERIADAVETETPS